MNQIAATWHQAVPAVNAAPASDRALVALAQKGDAEAFSELVCRHQRFVYNLAYRFMRDDVLTEDMTQEAFLKAFRLLEGFRCDCAFSTWLYRVTISVCLSELERLKKRNEVEFQEHHDSAAPVSGVPDFDEADLIRRCVAKLTPRYASVITLYYLDELSYEEIALALKISKGTLKTWMHRARNELRQIVERELAGA